MTHPKIAKRRRALALLVAMGAGWPVFGLAAGVSQQDFFDALRSQPDQVCVFQRS